MTETAREHLDRQIGSMRNERSTWLSHWQELNQNFSPRRGKFMVSDRNKGDRRNKLINNKGVLAVRTLRSGMMTGSTSPATSWFTISVADTELAKFGANKAWLEIVQKKLYRIFAASNLYRNLPLVYEESSVFGTAAMIHEDDFDTISRFTTFTAGEYMIGTNGKGQVDRFAREYQQTVYQLIDKFGLKNVSPQVRNFYDRGDYNVWVDVGHLIEPASIETQDMPKLPEKFTSRSVYYEVGRDALAPDFLQVKGYNEFPVYCPRWDVKAGDDYGFSAGMDALGDAKALQVQEKEKAKAIAKMVAPPMNVPTGMKNSQIGVMPGSPNFTDEKEGVRPAYQINPRVGELIQDIQLTEARIDKAFYVDLFRMISNMEGIQPRNVAELAARNEEALLELGPVVGNNREELKQPLIDRQFNKLVRLSEPGWNGLDDKMIIPPPPPDLQDMELKLEFTGLLEQAQKRIGLGEIERAVSFTGQVAQLIPEVIDKIDGDAVIETYAGDLGVPNNIIASDEKASEKREQRAQKQQQEEAITNAMTAVEGAKGVSEASR